MTIHFETPRIYDRSLISDRMIETLSEWWAIDCPNAPPMYVRLYRSVDANRIQVLDMIEDYPQRFVAEADDLGWTLISRVRLDEPTWIELSYHAHDYVRDLLDYEMQTFGGTYLLMGMEY